MITILRFGVLILSFNMISCLGLGTLQLNVCFDEPFYINPLESDLTPSQLQSAANVWNDALGKNVVVLSTIMPSDINVYFADTSGFEAWPGKHGVAISNRNEDGTLNHCTVLILEGKLTVNLLAHELGHCMGLRHDSEEQFPDSIMNPTVSYTDGPQFHHLLHLSQCPVTQMNEE